MEISLTTDGLRLNYRTTVQESVSGTYPIGTVMVLRGGTVQNPITLPGTWAAVYGFGSVDIVSAAGGSKYLLIRLA